MTHEKISILGKEADAYIIPFGPVNLVALITAKGIIACGLIDVAILNRFEYPAVRMKSVTEHPISDINDLLNGQVREVNQAAAALGISTGMNGHDVLSIM